MFLAALPLFACGTTNPPPELVQARAEYHRAQSGPASEVNPAQVHVAKESLDIAERNFNDDPGSPETRDRAYVALRKAQLAEAQADLMIAERNRDKARADAQALELQMGHRAQADLNTTRQQLASSEQQVAQERQARAEAERRAREAMDNLAKIATVKQETRGTVITLSGAVLFASGQSTLLPAAQASLDNVVSALQSQPERTALVEGHTDSQGARAFNMELSQRRAEAVRSYLISHNIAADRVRAQGVGPDRPVADNKSPEGRANNRRVEIILSPPSSQASQGSSPSTTQPNK